MNQLLEKALIDNQLNFQKLKPQHFIVAFEKLIPQVKEEFEDEIKLESNYENLFEKGFKSKQLSKVLSYLNHLNGVVQNEDLRNIYGKYVPQISAMYQEMGLDKRNYDKLINYKMTVEYNTLSDIRKKMINDIILNYELGGISLENDKKERLKEISYRLIQLSEKFENNIMDVEKTFEREIDIEQLKGLPERSFNNIEIKENGKAFISESSGVYEDILKYCDIEATRKLIYEEQLALGIKEGFDNRPILQEILILRKEEANILGYDNYASYSLAREMLKSPKEVLSFIEDLANKAIDQAKQESIEINNFGKNFLGRNVEFHDRGYVIEQMNKQLYAVNYEEIRQYFPVEKVLTGLFEIVEKLYAISFVKNVEKSIWHEDVVVYNVLNENEKNIGLLYLDLYKRKNKESGAWMLPKESKVDTEYEQKKPITYLVLNLAKNQKAETTVEFNDIVTLFHEMGHGLHNMLSEVKEEYFSGLSNVEHDAIELPSQFMENFAWDYEVLRKLSSHINTGEELPFNIFEKMQNAKFFLAANQILRQSIYSYLDMYIHTESVNPLDFETEIFNRWKTRDIDIRSQFLAVFSHIFAGGYAASYYSYKWSEVLSADAFHALKEKGNTYIEQKEMANKFKKTILSRGGTNDMLDNFIEFRGRKPDVKYLLIDNGIVEKKDEIYYKK